MGWVKKSSQPDQTRPMHTPTCHIDSGFLGRVGLELDVRRLAIENLPEIEVANVG